MDNKTKWYVFAAVIFALLFGSFVASKLHAADIQPAQCEEYSQAAFNAGGLKAQGKTEVEVINMVNEWAMENHADDNVADTIRAVVHWAYEQEESGNKAIAYKFMKVCRSGNLILPKAL